MLTEMLLVLLGGVLAIAGGAIQTLITAKSAAVQKHKEARENAYLGYIDALLKIKVDDQYGTVKTQEFWNSFRSIQAKLRLYGSADIIHKAEAFEDHLYECWQCNIDIGNTDTLKMDLVAAMRKELKID